MNIQQKRFKGIVCMMSMATLFTALFLGVMALEKTQAQNIPQTQGAQMNTPRGLEDRPEMPPKTDDGLMKGLGLIGAGIAFGLATLGAGVGIGSASSAAIGALSEKPSMFGISLVFVALCEGLVIFGFVIAAMIMGRI